jgi:hypothetical protein
MLDSLPDVTLANHGVDRKRALQGLLSAVIFTGVPESVDRIWGAETEPLTTGLSPERRLVGFN